MSTFDLENPKPAPGDALRDEAANLLSGRFGQPMREARVMGKKVDLYFTRRDYGKQLRFYVEAKDYERNLTRDEVVHIWADYSGIIEAHRPATLLLVTRGGLSPMLKHSCSTNAPKCATKQSGSLRMRRLASPIIFAGSQIFFASLVEREVDKEVRRPIGEVHRLAFLREVAFWLWTERGGATSFSASDLPDSLFAQLASGGAADVESLKREYLAGSFLEKKADDIYYFGHRSFAEYLVADRMVAKPPSEPDQPMYSALVRDGVLEFLLDAPNRAAFAKWTNSLSNSRGPIHFEYLSFLAEMLGGRSALRAALPATSIWIPILDLFDDGIVLGHIPINGIPKRAEI